MHAIRGALLDFVDDPWSHPGDGSAAARYVPDGVLVISDGVIVDAGPAVEVAQRLPEAVRAATVIPDRIIVPGFVDAHVHVPQTRVLGAYGEQLLAWLERWVFPEERRYFEADYAREGIGRFFDAVLASGTTTVQAFTTARPITTELVFEAAARRGVRIITGITALDRNAPEAVTTDADAFEAAAEDLIARFDGVGRANYAITPRFAYGASPELLRACGRLRASHPRLHVHTHISEHPAEVRGVLEMHGGCDDYLAVYERYGLVGPRFTGGHGVWLTDGEFERLARVDAAITFCPTSNLYLGSGLFRLGQAKDPDRPVRLGLGTDVGGGNRFGMLHVLDEAYKVGMLRVSALENSPEATPRDLAEADRSRLSWARAFYLATLGGARALHLDDRVGSFEVGKDADFVVLDWTQGPPGAAWHASMLWDGPGAPPDLETAGALLFAIMMVGDDRAVAQTWAAGERRAARDTDHSV